MILRPGLMFNPPQTNSTSPQTNATSPQTNATLPQTNALLILKYENVEKYYQMQWNLQKPNLPVSFPVSPL